MEEFFCTTLYTKLTISTALWSTLLRLLLGFLLRLLLRLLAFLLLRLLFRLLLCLLFGFLLRLLLIVFPILSLLATSRPLCVL